MPRSHEVGRGATSNRALRVGVGRTLRAGVDPGRCGPVGSGDATGVEEDAESVVLEAAEPVTAAFQFLDAEVEAFGWSVARAGGVVGEGLPAPPPGPTAPVG